MSTHTHTPVMLQETLTYLAPSPGKLFLDATLGLGGHTAALASSGADVIGIDRDQDAIELAKANLSDKGLMGSVKAYHRPFSSLSELLKEKTLDGALFDLGVSSLQLDDSSRGFSFKNTAPLDMRMDRGQGVTAEDLIAALSLKELARLFLELGEEPHAKTIARKIVELRKHKPITTTTELATLVESLVPRHGKTHPATRIFQALRMAVNTEREELKAALPSALNLLGVGGVCVVISFHSLEDRIVKRIFSSLSESWEILTHKPVTPSPLEISSNPRSRSAKLRAARRKA